MRSRCPDPELARLTAAFVRLWWKSEAERRFAGAPAIMLICDTARSHDDNQAIWRSALAVAADCDLGFMVSLRPPCSTRWKNSEPIGRIQVSLPKTIEHQRRICISGHLVREPSAFPSKLPSLPPTVEPVPPHLAEWNHWFGPEGGRIDHEGP